MIRLRRYQSHRLVRCLSNSRFKPSKRASSEEFKDLRKTIQKSSPNIRISEENNAQDATRMLLSKIRSENRTEPGYFDPGNSSLNLSLDNETLYNKIFQGAKERMDKRFHQSSTHWQKEHKNLIDNTSMIVNKSSDKNSNNRNIIREKLINHIKSAQISPEKANQPIAVGDLVALNEDSANLFIVISRPTDLDSNSYVFINNEGEIVFGPKKFIKLRFPGVIPSSLLEIVQSFVQLEKKFLDIAPIGISDAQFSRSKKSLPLELRDTSHKSYKNRKEMIVSEIADDFVVAQASSQLLTNSDVNTYIVPTEARYLYSEGLTFLSIKTFEKLPVISKKLEILHRALQYDEDGDILESPRTISIFQLLKYLKHFNLNSISEDTNGLINYIKIRDELSKKFMFPTSSSNLGKLMPELSDWSSFGSESYSISTFLALVLALKQQGTLWNINQQNQNNPPTSVNIIPLNKWTAMGEVLHYLKNENGFEEFSSYVIRTIKGETVSKFGHCESIISLFNDYIAGNLNGYPKVETALVTIIRLVDKAFAEKKLDSLHSVNYSYEYSKARAFDILEMINKGSRKDKQYLKNPSEWSNSLQLPKVSMMSNLSQKYFDYLDSCQNNIAEVLTSDIDKETSEKYEDLTEDFNISDPAAAIREDFKDIPVYCIDSETAHEIDDGISIHNQDNSYVVSVHVANPTSYIKPNSSISKIAFSRGSTLYLPEGPIMMLPNLISRVAGLGVNNQRTRTLVVQFKLEKKLIDDYIFKRQNDENFKPSVELSNNILKQIEQSSNVKLAIATNFPKNFTYNKVNEILNNSENIRNFQNESLIDKDVSNLFVLSNIATILKNIRLEIGDGLELGIPRSTVHVNYESNQAEFFEEIDSGYKIGIGHSSPVIEIFENFDQDNNSKSQLLVSNFMIFANYSASIFAKTNEIPIIFRSQEMKLNDTITKNLKELTQKSYFSNTKTSIEELNKILSVLTSATLQTSSKRHESLGLNSYSTVTSPLRRYVDMINHWKFEEFLLKKHDEYIKEHQLYFISNHLQNRELINKKIQQFSSKFWEGIFLRQYVNLLNKNKIEKPIVFKLLIKSDPKFGNVSVDVLGFNNLRAKLESNKKLEEKFDSGEIKIDSILESDKLKITRVDFIEDELVFELKE